MDRRADWPRRMEALRELRLHATHRRAAAEALIQLARSQDEPMELRVRAVQSLGRAVAIPNSEYRLVLEALKSLAADLYERPDVVALPTPVRAMAIKALYWAPVNEREMTAWLLGLLDPQRRPAAMNMREAALWSLATVSASDEAALRADDPSQARTLWRFFRLRYDPVSRAMIEVLELE